MMVVLVMVLAALTAPAALAQAPGVTTIATTTQATHVAHTAALLTGTLVPGSLVTTYHFEYGPTSAYGSSTPDAQLPPGSTAQAVSAQVSGLRAGTTYHYRLVAGAADGTVAGADVAFATPARAAAAPRPSSGAPAAKQYAGFHFAVSVFPDALVVRSVSITSQPAGWRLTVSCTRCVPRVRSTHDVGAFTGVRVPKGGMLSFRETRHGFHGHEMRMTARHYGTSPAELQRIAAAPFVRTTRTLPVS